MSLGDVLTAPRATQDSPTYVQRLYCAVQRLCCAVRRCCQAPHDFHTTAPASPEITTAAARSLAQNGACVLRPSCAELVPHRIVEQCRRGSRCQFDHWIEVAKQQAASHGHDDMSNTVREYKFQELYSRALWECRFDLTVLKGATVPPTVSEAPAGDKSSAAPAATDNDSSAAEPTTADNSVCWAALLATVDPLVRPILRASGLFGDDPIEVEAVGCVLSFPGAPSQCWHPDSESQVGLANVFVPLIDLTEANGPTAVRLGSQGGRATCLPPIRPLIESGSLLLFDWRVWHRGCANRSDHERPVAYITYARKGVEGASYKASLPSLAAWEDVWLRPSAAAATGATEATGIGDDESEDEAFGEFE